MKGLKKIKSAILICILVFTVIIALGQQSNTLFFMHDVPQCNLINPAVQIECKWFIGIPVLSSTHLNYTNTATTFNQMHDKDGNNYSLNMDKLHSQLHRVDLLSSELQLNLISLGYRRNEYYFTFNIAEKGYAAFTAPRDMFSLLFRGNTHFVGEEANLNRMSAYLGHYREYAFGTSKKIDKKLTLGGKAKLLFGKSNFSTRRSRNGLTTDATTFDLTFSTDMIMNTSMPMNVETGADGYVDNVNFEQRGVMDYLMNTQNKGLAVDLGVIYKYDDLITLSASIIDLGFIRWKSDVNNFKLNGDYTYTGPDITTGLTTQEYFDQLADALGDEFSVAGTQNAYFSWLPTQVYVGGTYQYRSNLNFGLLNRTEFFRTKIHPSFTASANADVNNLFATSLSVSYLNNTIMNVGLGFALHGRGFQFHVISDNVLAFFFPMDARNANLRFGFNLMLGCPRDRKENETSTPGLSGNCRWIEKAMDKEIKKKKALKK